jgi:hypothetical protein
VSNYVLLVNNHSTGNEQFFCYQEAPKCSSTVSTVVCCSLGTNNVSPNAQWKCEIDRDVYAAAEGRDPIPILVPGQILVTTTTIVKQRVQVSNSDPAAKNYTKMSINPLALSEPINQSDIPPGSFRVWIPSYVPTSQYYFNVGSPETNELGEDFLKWYITAPPAQNVDFQPEPIYYVSIGAVPQGKPIPSSGGTSLARCAFGNNISVISATYTADGSWCVKYS